MIVYLCFMLFLLLCYRPLLYSIVGHFAARSKDHAFQPSNEHLNGDQ